MDWRYEGNLFNLRVIQARMPERVSFGEVCWQPKPGGELVFCAGMGLLGPVWADLATLPISRLAG